MSVVVVENVVKRYGGAVALDGVSLRIAPGEVFALLGPNGAGKSSLVEILEGHRRRTAGTVAVLGFDPETGGSAMRERVGIVLQESGLEPELTVAEIVHHHAGLFPHPRAPDEVIALVGLTEKARARVRTLSGGQRRRLDLALGLVGDPDLIFLDEPTTGFNSEARQQAWELVRALRTFGKTILLTTHYMDEAQALSDRIAVIARGRIVAETPLDGIPAPFLRASDSEWVEATCTDPAPVLHALTGWALARRIELDALSVTPPTLEDVYLNLIAEKTP